MNFKPFGNCIPIYAKGCPFIDLGVGYQSEAHSNTNFLVLDYKNFTYNPLLDP